MQNGLARRQLILRQAKVETIDRIPLPKLVLDPKQTIRRIDVGGQNNRPALEPFAIRRLDDPGSAFVISVPSTRLSFGSLPAICLGSSPIPKRGKTVSPWANNRKVSSNLAYRGGKLVFQKDPPHERLPKTIDHCGPKTEFRQGIQSRQVVGHRLSGTQARPHHPDPDLVQKRTDRVAERHRVRRSGGGTDRPPDENGPGNQTREPG